MTRLGRWLAQGLRVMANGLWTLASRLDPPQETLNDDALIHLIDQHVPSAITTPTEDIVGTFEGRRGWMRPSLTPPTVQ